MDDHTELIRQQREVKRYRRSGRGSIGTGTISLLMIFTVLCFATLAMLSLSTAASDRRIQQRGFTKAVDLAAAEGAAAEAMAGLDEALVALDATDTDYTDEALRAAAGLGWEVDEAAGSCIWTVPLDGENELVTTVRIDPAGADTRFTLTSQVTKFTGSWEAEAPDALLTPGS